MAAQSSGISAKDQAAFTPGPEPYTLGPDSLPQPGVPRGAITQHHHVSRRVYPGVERDYWVYVPAQYDGSQPANLMVFQDGAAYLAPAFNAAIVFDNLIHKGEIPLTVGVFVNPGDRGPGNPLYGGTDNRSLEYDSLGDAYARLLIEELLPEVEASLRLSPDPERRAICGLSSGGICAFTAAWERPDAFRKVISHCGSFTDIRGGNQYPALVRKSAPRPLRVFLQSGSHDVDVIFGSWPIANQDMAAALAYREYDYQFVFGEGYHTLKHGAALFPATLCWIWR